MGRDYLQNYKDEIIDLIIAMSVVFGATALILLSIRDFPELYSFQALTQDALFSLLVFFYIIRYRFSYVIKANFVIWGVFILMLVGLYNNGFAAASKAYLIFVPTLAAFIFSFRRSLMYLLQFSLAYLVIGFLYTKGILVSVHAGVGTHYSDWLTEGVIYAFVCCALLLVGSRYKNKLYSVLSDLDKKNKSLEEQNDSLELKIKERTKELEDNNRELNESLEKLENAQSSLVQNEKMASLGVLTAGIAHDINNPLNYLACAKSLLEMFFEEHDYEDIEQKELILESLDSGVKAISSIVKGLNRYSRSNENMDEDCEIHSILGDCLLILNSKLKGKVDVEEDYLTHPILVKGNVGKLHQVFINIIANSAQAIPDKGVIKLRTKEEDGKVKVEISDSGIGIAPEHLDKITKPFFTTKDPEEGTGLGLSITYSIIEKHKGKLVYESELNKGTKAIVTLPLKTSE